METRPPCAWQITIQAADTEVVPQEEEPGSPWTPESVDREEGGGIKTHAWGSTQSRREDSPDSPPAVNGGRASETGLQTKSRRQAVIEKPRISSRGSCGLQHMTYWEDTVADPFGVSARSPRSPHRR
jgi:hypothetical protein